MVLDKDAREGTCVLQGNEKRLKNEGFWYNETSVAREGLRFWPSGGYTTSSVVSPLALRLLLLAVSQEL
jgi:hypothetical protein